VFCNSDVCEVCCGHPWYIVRVRDEGRKGKHEWPTSMVMVIHTGCGLDATAGMVVLTSTPLDHTLPLSSSHCIRAFLYTLPSLTLGSTPIFSFLYPQHKHLYNTSYLPSVATLVRLLGHVDDSTMILWNTTGYTPSETSHKTWIISSTAVRS
jgi:hypothetical protein